MCLLIPILSNFIIQNCDYDRKLMSIKLNKWYKFSSALHIQACMVSQRFKDCTGLWRSGCKPCWWDCVFSMVLWLHVYMVLLCLCRCQSAVFVALLTLLCEIMFCPPCVFQCVFVGGGGLVMFCGGWTIWVCFFWKSFSYPYL